MLFVVVFTVGRLRLVNFHVCALEFEMLSEGWFIPAHLV